MPVSELCRRERIHPTIYYKWLKDFPGTGKGRLRGDPKREATSEEVRQLAELESGESDALRKPILGPVVGQRRYGWGGRGEETRCGVRLRRRQPPCALLMERDVRTVSSLKLGNNLATLSTENHTKP